MQKTLHYGAISLLCLTTIVLIALQMKLFGFILLFLGLIVLFFCDNNFRKNILLVYFCVALLGITPINTSTAFPHAIQMGIPLFLVVFVPYYFTRNVYKNRIVRFPFHHGRSWYRSEILYVFITAAIAYFLLPIMMRNAGSYHNWNIQPGFINLAVSYIGLNVVGIWDELFFVSTVLGIFRKFLAFPFANGAQAVIFTSFLFTLGFRGWCFVVIFIFALLQGYIFKKTESLLYVLTIHLTFDLILHLTLVSLNHPTWLHIFIT